MTFVIGWGFFKMVGLQLLRNQKNTSAYLIIICMLLWNRQQAVAISTLLSICYFVITFNRQRRKKIISFYNLFYNVASNGKWLFLVYHGDCFVPFFVSYWSGTKSFWLISGQPWTEDTSSENEATSSQCYNCFKIPGEKPQGREGDIP